MAEQKQNTGQVDFADIQSRLDNKLIDPGQLNREQRRALDLAFKDKKLKGYASVSEMDAERNLARRDIAEDVRKKLAPLTPTSAFSLGIRRGTLVAAGDILGSFTPYIMDGKKLAIEAREMALKGKGVSYVPEIQRTAGKNTFKGVSNLLTKLPYLRNLKLFTKTAQVLDGFAGTIGAGVLPKVVASQALKTELKSQALGAAAAGAGSVTYDMVNFPAKFVMGANEDIAKIDQNQYNKMGNLEKMTYHAIDNAKTALMWNAGAFGLFGTLKGLGAASSKFFRLNPEQQAKLNEKILEQGLPLSPVLLAEGTGGASQLFNNLNRIIAVLPAASAEPLRFQSKFTAAALVALESNLKNALNVPLLHTEILANAVNATARDTYVKSGNVYGALYKTSEKQLNEISGTMDKYMNKIIDKQRNQDLAQGLPARGDEDYIRAVFPEGMDIPFLYAKNLRDSSNRIIQDLNKGTSINVQGRMQAKGLRSADFDPLNQFIREIKNRLDEFKGINGGDYLTPNQFFKLRRDWNQNYVNTFQTASSDVSGKVQEVLAAFEKDLNGVVKNPNANQLLETNPKLAKMHNFVKENLGDKEAQGFLNEFQSKIKMANQEYANANLTFSQSVNFYHNSKIAAIVRKMDSNALTVKQTLNMPGKQTITDVQGMNQLFKAAFNPTTGNASAVKELYELLGGAKYFSKEVQERAQYTMGLLMYRQFFDAFNKNVVVRKVSGTVAGAEFAEPFLAQGADVSDVIRTLSDNSPSFNRTVTELMRADMPSGKVSSQFVDKIKYEKKAITMDVIRQAIKDDLPITQKIFVTKEVAIQGAAAKPLTQDAVALAEKARLATVDGKIVPKSERIKSGFLRDKPAGAALELEELQLRLSGFQEFRFDKFAADIGLSAGDKAGREQLLEGFRIARGLNNTTAEKHVSNIETIIGALKANSLVPPGDASAFVTRNIILALGLGGGAGVLLMGGDGGLLPFVMTALVLKGGARAFNSPMIAQKWVDLYTQGQRLDDNVIKAMQPSRQAAFADVFNYLTVDDPDAPVISPGNIPEKMIIEYLQSPGTVQRVPTEEGLYQSIPREVKERFNPDLKRLRELSSMQRFDFQNYNNGLQVSNTRADILDGLSDQQNVQQIPPQLQGFLENPSAIEVPEGLKQASAQTQANIPAQTQAVYDSLFPQDKLGSAIAGSQNA
jgi:hypothetical protein